MKQKLVDIKRTTKITTKEIAELAQLSAADVFTVEIGGCATFELAQKVVRAFNQLSGMQVRMDDIKFSPLPARSALQEELHPPVKGNAIRGTARVKLSPQVSQGQRLL
jgi:hypothetical protein